MNKSEGLLDNHTRPYIWLRTQALLLSGRGAGMFTIIYKGRNLLSVVVYLTCPEIGKSMISRVNHDDTLELTTDHIYRHCI